MNIELAYGEGRLPIHLPEGIEATAIGGREADPAADPRRAIEESLSGPIDSPPIEECASGRSSAVISVPDATRPIPLDVILPPVLERIESNIPREKILVLFATGMHRPVTAGEAVRLLGEEIAREYRWESHDPDRTRTIGITARGTSMDVYERFLDAELRVAVGLVEPHLLAGYSGGRKLVAPGLVSLETMRVLHGPEIVGHGKARTGVLDGNPMHEEALEIALAAGIHFTLNVTLGRGRAISGVFAGDVDASHRMACEVLAERAKVRTVGERDLVITCGGGAPLDATFYQSVKGIAGAAPLVKEGGSILLCASCNEGWGSDHFLSLLKDTPDLPSFLEWASREGNFRKDQWMVQHLREAMQGRRVYVYSEHLDRITTSILGLTPVESADQGIDAALHGSANPSVTVIPDGPYTWAVPA